MPVLLNSNDCVPPPVRIFRTISLPRRWLTNVHVTFSPAARLTLIWLATAVEITLAVWPVQDLPVSAQFVSAPSVNVRVPGRRLLNTTWLWLVLSEPPSSSSMKGLVTPVPVAVKAKSSSSVAGLWASLMMVMEPCFVFVNVQAAVEPAADVIFTVLSPVSKLLVAPAANAPLPPEPTTIVAVPEQTMLVSVHPAIADSWTNWSVVNGGAQS